MSGPNSVRQALESSEERLVGNYISSTRWGLQIKNTTYMVPDQEDIDVSDAAQNREKIVCIGKMPETVTYHNAKRRVAIGPLFII